MSCIKCNYYSWKINGGNEKIHDQGLSPEQNCIPALCVVHTLFNGTWSLRRNECPQQEEGSGQVHVKMSQQPNPLQCWASRVGKPPPPQTCPLVPQVLTESCFYPFPHTGAGDQVNDRIMTGPDAHGNEQGGT
jgi:hypothetical protein